jgi:glycosyltransferase involved in cell wall biosynthesis
VRDLGEGTQPGRWKGSQGGTTRVRGGPDVVRLCLAAPTFHPFHSGAAERFRRYLPGFLEEGVIPFVFTGTPEAKKARLSGVEPWWLDMRPGALLPPEEVDGIPVWRVRLPDVGGRRRAIAFARALARHCLSPATRADVVQLFTPSAVAYPWLRKLHAAGVPLVAGRTMMPARAAHPVGRGMESLSHRIAAAPISCDVVGTGAMGEAYRRLGIHHRLEVIPHGVDLARFRPPRDPAERREVRRRLGLPEMGTLLLFVGALSRRKRVHLLMEAWVELARGLPTAHLLLVGPGWREPRQEPSPYQSQLEAILASADDRGRFHAPGQAESVEEYYRAADIFVFPSSREGMPNAMVEAMASGLPVVTTPFLGLSDELGSSGETFLAAEPTSEGLARTLRSLLADDRRRSALGETARAWVEENLSLPVAVRRHVGLYRELAGIGPGGGRKFETGEGG